MSEFKPIVRNRTVSAKVAEQIVLRIQQGAFPIGTKLPAETELARRFSVSRPTVREALGALQFAGYLDSSTGSGTRVASLKPVLPQGEPQLAVTTPNDIIDLFEARLLIEPRVAASAAQAPNLEKLEEAKAITEGMSIMVADPGQGMESDLRVHRAFAAICPNAMFRDSAIRLIEAASSPSLQVTREKAWTTSEIPRLWEVQHHAVLEAIKSGNAESAENASWTHLSSAAQNALDALSSDPALADEPRQRLERLLRNGPSGQEAPGGLTAFDQ